MSIKSIHVVIDRSGKVWKDSARVSHDQCRNDFVKEWMTPIEKYIDSHTCWVVWGCFERAGWRIEEIEIPSAEMIVVTEIDRGS